MSTYQLWFMPCRRSSRFLRQIAAGERFGQAYTDHRSRVRRWL